MLQEKLNARRAKRPRRAEFDAKLMALVEEWLDTADEDADEIWDRLQGEGAMVTAEDMLDDLGFVDDMVAAGWVRRGDPDDDKCELAGMVERTLRRMLPDDYEGVEY